MTHQGQALDVVEGAAAPFEAGPGFITCAITSRETIPETPVLDSGLRFPSADLVGLAAQSFPLAVRGSGITSHARVFHGANLSEWHSDREGPVAVLSVAPGLVRVSRFDPARRERAFANQATGRTVAARGAVTKWTAKSRARMRVSVLELDLHAYVVGRVPAMMTVTLPGDWRAVAPDAATARQVFSRFVKRFERRWGKPQWLWKREFQRRGAPHWHLWLVPPAEIAEFRLWMRSAWVESMGLESPDGHTPETPGYESCVCCEACKSWHAGTNLDRAAGINARDPQRLATYFLKESHGGDSKAYQNEVPPAWCVGYLAPGELGPSPERWVPRRSVGRFWGVAGLSRAVSSVELDEKIAVSLWRTMSAVRERKYRPAGKPVTRVVRSRPVTVELDAVAEEERVQSMSGEYWVVSERDHVGVTGVRVPRRPVSRVVASSAGAGWVSSNDGPAFASQLARYARLLTGENLTTRDSLPPVLAHLTPRQLNGRDEMRLRVLRAKHRK